MVALIVGGFVALYNAGKSSRLEAGGVLLRYTRSGGFTGETATLVVRDDGRATATFDLGRQDKRRSFELTDNQLADLDEVFEEVSWPEVSQSFPFPEGAADIFEYDVNYGGVAVRSFDPLRPRVRPVVLHIERNLLPDSFSTFR